MEQLLNLLNQAMNENMLRMTLSGKRHAEIPDKVKIRPVQLKDICIFRPVFQTEKRNFIKTIQKKTCWSRLENG